MGDYEMIDKLDQKLMHELQIDGRQSYTHLAKMLDVSEGTIRKRVKDLRNSNVMKIRAVVNPNEIGYSFICVMALQVRMADLREVGETLAQKPNIYYLSFVAGRYDLIALIVTQTPEELSDFIKEHISSIPSIIRTETFVNLEVIKGPWAATWDILQLLSNSDQNKTNM